MGAAIYTEDEEHRYGLPPLPEVPFVGEKRSRHLNGQYEVARLHYRETHPGRTKGDE